MHKFIFTYDVLLDGPIKCTLKIWIQHTCSVNTLIAVPSVALQPSALWPTSTSLSKFSLLKFLSGNGDNTSLYLCTSSLQYCTTSVHHYIGGLKNQKTMRIVVAKIQVKWHHSSRASAVLKVDPCCVLYSR